MWPPSVFVQSSGVSSFWIVGRTCTADAMVFRIAVCRVWCPIVFHSSRALCSKLSDDICKVAIRIVKIASRPRIAFARRLRRAVCYCALPCCAGRGAMGGTYLRCDPASKAHFKKFFKKFWGKF